MTGAPAGPSQIPAVPLPSGSSRRGIVLALTLPLLAAVFMFAYHYGDVLARGRDDAIAVVVIEELTGPYSALPSLLVLLATVFRWPLTRERWKQRLPIYLVLVPLLGTCATLLMWGSRSALFALLDMGTYDYGTLRWRIPMELGLQVITYSMAIGLFHFIRYYRDTKQTQLHAAELEAALTRARLEAIEARLEPHFIFNSLNTISAVMDEDIAAAERLLGHLGDLLRRAMRRDAPAVVPLEEEIGWLEGYLALMQQRHGSRLGVAITVDPEARAAPVPRFLLQPLVENAIRHGVAATAGPGCVEVEARIADGRLAIEVRDNGHGVGSSSAPGTGFGWTGTATRLRLLYGDDHRFDVTPRPGGGTVARVVVPLGGAPAPGHAP
jgi:signal transduction histidine kinase